MMPFADLAYHYAEAQNVEKAVKYSLAAGKEALDRWSNTEAAKHFQYVLERIGDRPERLSERLAALEGLGDAYYAGDSFSQAACIFEKLANLQSGADKLRALRKAMFAAFYLGDIPLLARLTQKAEENATADRLEAGRVLHQKARVLGIQDDIPNCVRISEEALKIFEEEYAISDAAWILFTLGANLTLLGQYERGVASALRSNALYDELGDMPSQMEAYLYACMAFFNSGLLEEGRRMGDKVIELNEKSRICDYIRLIPVYAYAYLDLKRTDIQDSISRALKALEYAEKTDSSLYLGVIYESLTIGYALAEDPVRMEEYFGKLVNLPKDVVSNVFSQGFLKMAMGVYYAARNEVEKSNECFSTYPLQDTASLGMSPHWLIHRHLYAWALSRQGRMDEAESQLEQIGKILETAQQRFSHASVHTSLIASTRPEVGQVFEVRLDLVNVSNSPASIVKVENLFVPGLTISEISPNCFVREETVELKDKTINFFEVKTVKLALKATKPRTIQLTPTVTYIDDLGETKASSTRTFTINVQPTRPKYEVLPGRVPTGFAELDALLFGGIPEKYAVALTSPSTDERELLIKSFLETGAKAGETSFHVTAEAANTKTLATEYPSNFHLFLCNPQADAMIENAPNASKLKGVENLTDIDIALTKAFRTLNSATAPRRVCINVVSDALLQHHAVNTRRWLSALLPTLKSKGFTILAVIDPDMHPREEVQAISGLFEGEIRVFEKETPEGAKQTLKIQKLLNQKYMQKEIVLAKQKLHE
jgi:tetratricopeptide (TPR) repeat protein/KaiC/GvpD/RAD55 family RecA-like ATPase